MEMNLLNFQHTDSEEFNQCLVIEAELDLEVKHWSDWS